MLARSALVLCVIFWGWSFVATKVCLDYMDPVELMGLRLLIALPVMLLIAAAKRISLRFERRDYPGLIWGSLIIAAHFLIQVTGLKYTTATNTGWIISVTPLVMAALAWLLLKERITRNTVLGILVATGGIFLLVSRGDLANVDWLQSVGDWLILASAHTWALYTVVARDVTSRRPPLAVTVAVLIPATVMYTIYMVVRSDWSALLKMPGEAVWSILYLGVFAMALAHWFWQEGVAQLGAARAGIFLYIEPLATTALAVPYLGEEFGIMTAVGGLLVLAGVWVAGRRSASQL